MRVMLAAIVLGALVMGNLSVRAQQSASDAALHLRIAQKAVEDGEFEIAVSEVRTAATLAPTDPVIQFALATILDKIEKSDEALAALDKAQALNLPDALREQSTDLRATLLYKQQRSRRQATEVSARIAALIGTWYGRHTGSEKMTDIKGSVESSLNIPVVTETTLTITGAGSPLAATLLSRTTPTAYADLLSETEVEATFDLIVEPASTKGVVRSFHMRSQGDRQSDPNAALREITLTAEGQLSVSLDGHFEFIDVKRERGKKTTKTTTTVSGPFSWSPLVRR